MVVEGPDVKVLVMDEMGVKVKILVVDKVKGKLEMLVLLGEGSTEVKFIKC